MTTMAVACEQSLRDARARWLGMTPDKRRMIIEGVAAFREEQWDGDKPILVTAAVASWLAEMSAVGIDTLLSIDPVLGNSKVE